jgi:hypothetical protein
MKFLILLSLGLLVSACGATQVGQSNNSLGQTRSLAPLEVTSQTKDDLLRICQALTTKNAMLNQYINAPFTFAVRKKDCDGKDVGVLSNVPVSVQRPVTNYVFKRQADNVDFLLPDVETNEFGIVSPICSRLSNFQNPIVTGTGAIWVSTRPSGADCTALGTEQCLMIETGVPQNNTYRIVSREWIKFNVNYNQPNIGFYTYRKRVSATFCESGKFIQEEVTLK